MPRAGTPCVGLRSVKGGVPRRTFRGGTCPARPAGPARLPEPNRWPQHRAGRSTLRRPDQAPSEPQRICTALSRLPSGPPGHPRRRVEAAFRATARLADRPFRTPAPRPPGSTRTAGATGRNGLPQEPQTPRRSAGHPPANWTGLPLPFPERRSRVSTVPAARPGARRTPGSPQPRDARRPTGRSHDRIGSASGGRGASPPAVRVLQRPSGAGWEPSAWNQGGAGAHAPAPLSQGSPRPVPRGTG